jgi:uncharacterized protein (TIGR02391 family)
LSNRQASRAKPEGDQVSIDPAIVKALFEKYITQLEEAKKLPHHLGNPAYEGAILGVTTLLEEIFDEVTAIQFHQRIRESLRLVEDEMRGTRDAVVIFHNFCRHLDTCIAVSRIYLDKFSLLRPEICNIDLLISCLHPAIRDATHKLFLDGHYTNAVENACKALDDMVRNRSGRHDLSGTKLMQMVFSPKRPVLVFNDGSTESDKSEQDGMMYLYTGTMLALRNPRAHGLLKDDREEATEILMFISFLARALASTRLSLATGP